MWTEARGSLWWKKADCGKESMRESTTYMTFDLSLHVSGHQKELEELLKGRSTASQTQMWCGVYTMIAVWQPRK